MKGSSNKLS